MIEIQQYRSFSLIVGGITALGFGIFFPWIKGNNPQWKWVILGLVLIALGSFFPRALKYPYLAWMKVGHILGTINNFLILNIFFFVMFTPLAFLLKICGRRSPLELGWDKNLASYRKKSSDKINFKEIF